MSSKAKNKNSLFLIELIMVIFFFSIMSAICVSIFAKSYSLSKKSNSIDKALIISQNAAECLKSSDGTYRILDEFFHGKQQDTKYQVYYDEAFEMTESAEQSAYELNIVSEKKEPDIITYHISFFNQMDKDCLIQLDVKKHMNSSEEGE